jgi:hypothetical protein
MTEFRTELYNDSIKRLPTLGQQIIGYQKEDLLVVYQAYKPTIAKHAVATQTLGGSEFSYSRMSWIKPNFLWMMFRCGWAGKENQEAVLAITITKRFFIEILQESVISSFNADFHSSHEQWKSELDSKEVRLQWDPDHDPFGNKISRRAIQLGLKGDMLERFGKKEVQTIRDITPFVKQQKALLDSKSIDELMIPYETVVDVADQILVNRIGIKQ